jgi:NDP-sugar pyrophosphorylase family protein
MPMAGKGERLAKAGFSKPKPLIEVAGVPMFIRALKFLKLLKVSFDLHLIIDSRKINSSEIQVILDQYNIVGNIHTLNKSTNGSADTVMKISHLLAKSDPILIVDCDIEFSSNGFFDYINDEVENSRYDGCIAFFNSNEDKFSFAEIITETGLVSRVAEKEVISNNAIIGAYYFKDFLLFYQAFGILKSQKLKEGDEYFSSKVLGILVRQQNNIKAFEGRMQNFGSFDDLKKFI